MKRKLHLAAYLLTASLFPSSLSAQIAESSFAADDDGWVSVTLPYPSAIPPTVLVSFTPNWHAASGGYISMVDPDGTTTGNTEYWQAPAEFLGSKSSAYGGTLAFDIACAPGLGLFDQEDVILLGGGLTLVYDLGTPPGGAFKHYSVPMFETGWKRDNAAGPAATQLEFLAALASVTDIFIRAEFQLGTDTEYLDNVVMSAPVTAVSGIVPDFSLGRNAPNPFSASTRIALSMSRDSVARVDVYDVSGRLVRRLWDGPVASGERTIDWDGRDSHGRAVAGGVYFCRATSGSTSEVRRMVLVR